MRIRITDAWPSGLDLDPDVADAVFDRDRIAAALAELEKAPIEKIDSEGS